jgi:hypothetical protein
VTRLATVLAMLLLTVRAVSAQPQEYKIEIPDLDPKPYSLGGFVEFRPIFYRLDPESALYGLRFFAGETTTSQYNSQLQLDAGYRKGVASVSTRTVLDIRKLPESWDNDVTFYEAYLSLKPSASFTLDAGKKTLKWGKGYIWNPAAFLDRPKDPDDPAQALEGYVVLSADIIKSFSGPLRTLAVSPVLIPVYDHVNESFGRPGTVNVAGKAYVLLYDTDIDVMFLSGGSRPGRFGFDASRNLRFNLEVHGEYAFVPEARRLVADGTGRLSEETVSAASWLVGARYLSSGKTTVIVDLYRNGQGYREDEMRAFFDLARSAALALAAQGDDRLIAAARRAADAGYSRPAPMGKYLYARVSQPDAFGILYLGLAASSIWNLADRSVSLVPELTYKATENLELRSQVAMLLGGRATEFGEKQADLRLEMRVRYYF